MHRIVKGGCKCLNPSSGGLEQLVTNCIKVKRPELVDVVIGDQHISKINSQYGKGILFWGHFLGFSAQNTNYNKIFVRQKVGKSHSLRVTFYQGQLFCK